MNYHKRLFDRRVSKKDVGYSAVIQKLDEKV